jgi:hypothetical protein
MAEDRREPEDWPGPEWYLDLTNRFELTGFRRDRVLVAGRTEFQAFEIFENRLWGRMLILDERLQSAEADEFIYHEALVQPAMLAHPEPRRVLVMGGGEGATLREVLRHPGVTRAVMVDIDGELVGLCREWLPSFHAGAFDDPRTELVFADGRGWLAAQPDRDLDVIILDLPEPLEEGGPQAVHPGDVRAGPEQAGPRRGGGGPVRLRRDPWAPDGGPACHLGGCLSPGAGLYGFCPQFYGSVRLSPGRGPGPGVARGRSRRGPPPGPGPDFPQMVGIGVHCVAALPAGLFTGQSEAGR